MTIAFVSANAIDPTKDFSFSMNVAVFKEADLNSADDNGGALAPKNKTPSLPKSLRFLSIGMTSVPLNPR
jgi:hypothetical protein